MGNAKNVARIILSPNKVYKLKRTKDGTIIARSRPKGLAKHWTILERDGRITIHSTDEATGLHDNLLAEDMNSGEFQQEILTSVFAPFRDVRNFRHLEKLGVSHLVNPEDTRAIFAPLFYMAVIDVQIVLDTAMAVDIQDINYQSPRSAWRTAVDTVFFAVNHWQQFIGTVISIVREYEGKNKYFVLFADKDDILREAEHRQRRYDRVITDLMKE